MVVANDTSNLLDLPSTAAEENEPVVIEEVLNEDDYGENDGMKKGKEEAKEE